MTAPLFGLVLAGGASTRMRTDKATLDYHGQPQLQWAFELLSKFCTTTFVSVRPDQRDDETRATYPQIVDRQPGTGPIAGISAALLAHPKAAWLVLACDLPFVNERTLKYLIAARDPQRVATAYRSSHDGLPEPLCAIWEPAARDPLSAYMATGKQCPRKFLINADVALLDLPDARALDNVNTPEEYGSVMSTMNSAPGAGKRIKVQYYALLREQAGRSEEAVTTQAGTPRELYEELRRRYPFSLAPEMLRVAVNAEFGDWSQPLSEGDAVVFIPPVAGG
jgi:molybdopterin-guanine dinucleotide biosynthesis protein A